MSRPDRAPDSAEEGPTTEKAPLKFRRATLLRVIAHLAAWLPFVTGAARLAHDGWFPLGDNAAIALRSWNSLTAHGPLVGQATRLAHGVFDPGPLEYWLLAIPVHISPEHGILWGAAICCMAACSVAIEAAWAAGGELAGLAASALTIGMVLWLPAIAVPPSWNPSFGAIFFLAALAAAWSVLCGHRGWWPALVVTASIASQAHLMFALASVALVLLTLVAGLIDTVRSKPARATAGYRWLIIGVLLGVACWLGPFIQQFTSRDGNLSKLIANSESGLGPHTGAVFGLKAISAAVQPPPLWWKSSLSANRIATEISGHSPWPGVAALIILVVAIAAALGPLRSRRLAALAAVTLVLSLGALVTYSSIPVRPTTLLTLGYLIMLILPLGVGCWLVTGTLIVLTVRWAQAQARARARDGAATPGAAAPGWLPARWATGAVIAGAVAVAALAALSLPRQSNQARYVMDDPALAVTRTAASEIEHKLPGQNVALIVQDTREEDLDGRVTVSLTWALTPSGFHAEVTKTKLARELGSSYVYHGRAMKLVTVVIRDGHVTVHVTKASNLPAALRLASSREISADLSGAGQRLR
jgi:hypothetical protein